MTCAARLKQTLAAAGLQFRLHRNNTGSAVAGFRLAMPFSEPLTFSVRQLPDTLRVTLQDVLPGPPTVPMLRFLNDVAQDWPVGTPWFDLARNACQASIEVISSEAVSGRTLRAILEHLGEAMLALRQGEVPFTPLETVPGAGDMRDVAQAMDELGLPYKPIRDGRMLVSSIDGPPGEKALGTIEMYKSDQRFLHARTFDPRAPVIPPDADTLLRLQATVPSLGFGNAVLLQPSGHPAHLAKIVLPWTRVTSSLVESLVCHACVGIQRVAHPGPGTGGRA